MIPLSDRCTVQVQVVQVEVNVELVKKKEKGHFGGWRKEEPVW